MRPHSRIHRARPWMLVTALATTGGAPAATVPNLPPIVFVSRQPVPGEVRAVPGLGPHHRAVVTGGRLMVRERDGRVRELLASGSFLDVSDPAVSHDARRIAFAGVTRAGGPWRIWVVDAGGGTPRPVTADPDTARGSAAAADDLDPCWLDAKTLAFASTRFPQRAQYADLPVTNLFTTAVAPQGPQVVTRITAERNGAEEPAVDSKRGELLFSRWWFNRHLAAGSPEGIASDPAAALARDSVNLWQTMAMASDRRPRLAAADLSTRRGTMGYQPAVLADGSIAAVYGANLGLSPRPGGLGIHVLSAGFGEERRLAGALVAGRPGDVYGGTEGLAPPAACSPAGLPDGRILFSYDPGARGEIGLYVMGADGSRITRVLDLPGTLELDAVPLVARPALAARAPLAGDDLADPGSRPSVAWGPGPDAPAATPPARREDIDAERATFRFHDLDVFADGPEGSPARGAAPRTEGARLRFYATLARPDRPGGDSAILLREVPVGPGGEVNAGGLPADLPMFEQLVEPDGRVLMTAHGPAHVAGSNAGVAGTTSRCVGCHLGHSTLPVRPARGGGDR